MIGIHNSKSSHILDANYKTMEESIKYETDLLSLNASQIFTHGPRNRRRNKMNYDKIKQVCTDNNIKLYVHGSYLTVGLWSINKEPEKISINVKHIIDSLMSCLKLNARGLVIHLPKKEVNDIKECFDILENHILNHNQSKLLLKCRILLEAPAMAPDDNKTYETPKKINKLCNILSKSKLKWGLCIDTAHLWSGGIDFSKRHSWDLWISELTDNATKRIKLIHLNGALKKNFGRGKDVHIIPFSEEDAIWSSYISPEFKMFINNQKKNDDKSIDLSSKLSKSEIDHIKTSSLYDILQYSKCNNIDIICEININNFVDAKFLIDLLHLINE
jgi:endonuclease IV